MLLLCAARLPVIGSHALPPDSLDIASACRRSQGAAVRVGRGVPQSLRGGGAARGARAVVSVLLLACVSAAAAACASGEGDTYAGGEVRARARTAPPRTILPVWYLCTLVSWSPPKCMCAA